MELSLIEILKIIVLGIVEGITEWLPISSTGHMLLVDEIMPLQVSKDFMNMFLVLIQLGAILAVVVIYFRKLWPFSKKEPYFIKKDTFNLWLKIAVACIPAIIIGLPFDDIIEEKFYNPATIATTLIIYGIAFIVIEKRNVGSKPKVTELSQITYPIALFIGAFQVLAIIPGTSRSGATIVAALLLGTSRYVATEFTFFLAIPAMFGASLLKLVKFGFNFTSYEVFVLLLGMAVAFIVSILAIKFLIGYIKNNDFKVFGYYRIVLGCLIIAYFLLAR
ncbi:undecaprenyl-diphosphate phosphatase [Clostridium sp. Marseille-P299]|uniref:undecaprenyl-diphosphate phosphatase n=1 Tax=Clostridium sp. Marseille-P299 TaxID=1805477 RepID=UPI00082AF847|nr:undecaprenyl-diphosphate phosphatase [Clostridium sp. Marseille-P299]